MARSVQGSDDSQGSGGTERGLGSLGMDGPGGQHYLLFRDGAEVPTEEQAQLIEEIDKLSKEAQFDWDCRDWTEYEKTCSRVDVAMKKLRRAM